VVCGSWRFSFPSFRYRWRPASLPPHPGDASDWPVSARKIAGCGRTFGISDRSATGPTPRRPGRGAAQGCACGAGGHTSLAGPTPPGAGGRLRPASTPGAGRSAPCPARRGDASTGRGASPGRARPRSSSRSQLRASRAHRPRGRSTTGAPERISEERLHVRSPRPAAGCARGGPARPAAPGSALRLLLRQPRHGADQLGAGRDGRDELHAVAAAFFSQWAGRRGCGPGRKRHRGPARIRWGAEDGTASLAPAVRRPAPRTGSVRLGARLSRSPPRSLGASAAAVGLLQLGRRPRLPSATPTSRTRAPTSSPRTDGLDPDQWSGRGATALDAGETRPVATWPTSAAAACLPAHLRLRTGSE